MLIIMQSQSFFHIFGGICFILSGTVPKMWWVKNVQLFGATLYVSKCPWKQLVTVQRDWLQPGHMSFEWLLEMSVVLAVLEVWQQGIHWLCSGQSSAGTIRETVYRRRPGLPGRWTHHLEQPTGQRDISPSLSTFRLRLETFLFQASFPDIITDPR